MVENLKPTRVYFSRYFIGFYVFATLRGHCKSNFKSGDSIMRVTGHEISYSILLQLHIWNRQLVLYTPRQFRKWPLFIATMPRTNLSATWKSFKGFNTGNPHLFSPSAHCPCLQKCLCGHLVHPDWRYLKLLVLWSFWLKQQKCEQLN